VLAPNLGALPEVSDDGVRMLRLACGDPFSFRKACIRRKWVGEVYLTVHGLGESSAEQLCTCARKCIQLLLPRSCNVLLVREAHKPRQWIPIVLYPVSDLCVRRVYVLSSTQVIRARAFHESSPAYTITREEQRTKCTSDQRTLLPCTACSSMLPSQRRVLNHQAHGTNKQSQIVAH
jgi:hypothetical protein